MKIIKVSTMSECTITPEKLLHKLDDIIMKFQNESTFYHTEASLIWIIRGGINYFDKLDTHFLGDGNKTGIPEMEADYFVNNLYRLINALDYLSQLWKITFIKTSEINLLLDIRTLIVHSGQQINNIKSFELEKYKDNQLGRIMVCKNHNLYFQEEFSNYDYCLQIWCDKHDKLINKHLSEVDYSLQNECFNEISIYLNAKDVRNIVLSMVENFLDICDKKSVLLKKPFQFPNIKDNVINTTEDNIDFEKISRLISKDLRGGYLIENGLEHWNGFGLQKLYEHTKNRANISEEVRSEIIEKINNVVSKYWDDYEKETIPDSELPNLDIRDVFSDYTPEYEEKHYLEVGKLFFKIAPYFNIKDRYDETDINYLARFITSINEALGIQMNLEQTVDDLICDYFIKSVEIQLNKKKLKEIESH